MDNQENSQVAAQRANREAMPTQPLRDSGKLQTAKPQSAALASPRPTMLLHSCCGPCSTSVIERLVDRFELCIFFYNPNITNSGEYQKRLAAEKHFIAAYNETLPLDKQVKLIEGEYDPASYLKAVRGLEAEPENGDRCTVCFELRMKRTAMEAEKLGMENFTTTLSVSPHKSTARINAIGYELEKSYAPAFLDESFKKKDGFKRSIELSREYGLYRQSYCGCIFSEREGAGADDPALECVLGADDTK